LPFPLPHFSHSKFVIKLTRAMMSIERDMGQGTRENWGRGSRQAKNGGEWRVAIGE
jgi:hypothetical protein